MPLYEMTPDALTVVPTTTFASAEVRERQDLQRLLRDHVEVVYADTLVIAEEWGEFEDSRRRIDLLGVHSSGDLVVIELKRTEDGGHMELQAIRYAAMVSAMTFARATEIYADHLRKTGRDPAAAASLLADHLGGEDEPERRFARRVRVALVSADFGKELTTAVLWLNDNGLDVTCVQLRPHALDGRTLLDVRQVIPLPEAAAYQTKLKEKAAEEAADEIGRTGERLRFWQGLLPRALGRTKLHANISPAESAWVGTSAGLSGLALNYSTQRHAGRVELYIYAGKESMERNKQAFDHLHARREQIERDFGGSLTWERLDGKLSARISHATTGGYRDPEEQWPKAQDQMIDAMIRFEAALRPHLDSLEP